MTAEEVSVIENQQCLSNHSHIKRSSLCYKFVQMHFVAPSEKDIMKNAS